MNPVLRDWVADAVDLGSVGSARYPPNRALPITLEELRESSLTLSQKKNLYAMLKDVFHLPFPVSYQYTDNSFSGGDLVVQIKSGVPGSVLWLGDEKVTTFDRELHCFSPLPLSLCTWSPFRVSDQEGNDLSVQIQKIELSEERQKHLQERNTFDYEIGGELWRVRGGIIFPWRCLKD